MGTPELLEVAERVPQVAALQPAPLSDHFTLLLRRVVVTVAVNWCVPPGAATVAVCGETVTVVCAATLGTKIRMQQVNRTRVASNRRAEERGDAGDIRAASCNAVNTNGHAIPSCMATIGWEGRIVAVQVAPGE